MSRKLLVTLNSQVPKAQRVAQDDFPHSVEEVPPTTPDPQDGRLVMTREEYVAYLRPRWAACRAWQAARPEAAEERRQQRAAAAREKYETTLAAGYTVPSGKYAGKAFGHDELEAIAQLADLTDTMATVEVSTVDDSASVELSMLELRQLLRASRDERLRLYRARELAKAEGERGRR